MMSDRAPCERILNGESHHASASEATPHGGSNAGLKLLRVLRSPFDELQVAPQCHHLLALSLAPLNVRWRTAGAWERVKTTEAAALFVPAGVASACGNDGKLDAIHLHISPSKLRALLPETAQQIEGRAPGNLGGEWVRALAWNMMSAYEGGPALAELASDALLIGVGAVLLNARELFGTRTIRRGLAAWQLERVQTRLMDGLDRDVGLDELAEIVGLTPTYLCTAFREATGLPPHQWQKRRRIDRASAMLQNGDAGIAEIARTVGYSNPSHFATVFKAVTGWTPSAWRRERRR